MRTSEKQTKILDFIKLEIEQKGYPPSVREICSAVGLKSTSSVHAHLTQLEKRGLIRRDSTKPRAMEITDGALTRGRTVPLIGRVTAGKPVFAEENIEEYMVMPQQLFGPEELFALRVQGESMIDAGIFDGDIILLHKQDSAENGDIIVALLEEEATVKRVFYEDKRVRLQPENKRMSPIIVDNVQILGKLTALVRKY